MLFYQYLIVLICMISMQIINVISLPQGVIPATPNTPSLPGRKPGTLGPDDPGSVGTVGTVGQAASFQGIDLPEPLKAAPAPDPYLQQWVKENVGIEIPGIPVSPPNPSPPPSVDDPIQSVDQAPPASETIVTDPTTVSSLTDNPTLTPTPNNNSNSTNNGNDNFNNSGAQGSDLGVGAISGIVIAAIAAVLIGFFLVKRYSNSEKDLPPVIDPYVKHVEGTSGNYVQSMDIEPLQSEVSLPPSRPQSPFDRVAMMTGAGLAATTFGPSKLSDSNDDEILDQDITSELNQDQTSLQEIDQSQSDFQPQNEQLVHEFDADVQDNQNYIQDSDNMVSDDIPLVFPPPPLKNPEAEGVKSLNASQQDEQKRITSMEFTDTDKEAALATIALAEASQQLKPPGVRSSMIRSSMLSLGETPSIEEMRETDAAEYPDENSYRDSMLNDDNLSMSSLDLEEIPTINRKIEEFEHPTLPAELQQEIISRNQSIDTFEIIEQSPKSPKDAYSRKQSISSRIEEQGEDDIVEQSLRSPKKAKTLSYDQDDQSVKVKDEDDGALNEILEYHSDEQ